MINNSNNISHVLGLTETDEDELVLVVISNFGVCWKICVGELTYYKNKLAFNLQAFLQNLVMFRVSMRGE